MEKDIEDKFIEATERWYSFVGKDHHKDRDCHWFVCAEEQWSYGHSPEKTEWVVRHHGYVADEQEFYGSTREDAMLQAANFIDKFIRDNLAPTT